MDCWKLTSHNGLTTSTADVEIPKYCSFDA